MKCLMQLLARRVVDKCVKYEHPHRGQVGKTGISQNLWNKSTVDWLREQRMTGQFLCFLCCKFSSSLSGSGIL